MVCTVHIIILTELSIKYNTIYSNIMHHRVCIMKWNPKLFSSYILFSSKTSILYIFPKYALIDWNQYNTTIICSLNSEVSGKQKIKYKNNRIHVRAVFEPGCDRVNNAHAWPWSHVTKHTLSSDVICFI